MPSFEEILVELTSTNVLTRWPCHVCGGCTEKVEVLAEVASGPHKGLRVCKVCIEAGDIDAKLQQQAEALEGQAASVRALIGRLKVPTWTEYNAYADRAHVASWASRRDDASASVFKRVMADDALYQATRQSWSYIDDLHRGGGKAAAARLAAEFLGITPDEAGRRLDIALFAAYCMGSAHGDFSDEAQDIVGAVMTDAALREYYASEMADYEKPHRDDLP
jgi:hypothetical protein